MRLHAEKLKKHAEAAGVTVEQLGEAVERTGLKGVEAVKAVRNWMAGRDHPRCKKADIDRLAAAVGVRTRDIARFTSEVRFHRGSPKKAKLVVDMVRGKAVTDADDMLRFSTKRAATNIRKAILAATAEAEQVDADFGNLVVSEARVDKAAHIKRFRPKDRGRAHPILKRTSHILITVEERG